MFHVVKNNIKKYKDQHNDNIENDLDFDSSFNLPSRTKYPLLLVTDSLKGGRKNKTRADAGLTCLYNSGATNMMIKIRLIK